MNPLFLFTQPHENNVSGRINVPFEQEPFTDEKSAREFYNTVKDKIPGLALHKITISNEVIAS